MYPLATFERRSGFKHQRTTGSGISGQIIETEDGKEIVTAVDGQGAYMTEVIDQ